MDCSCVGFVFVFLIIGVIGNPRLRAQTVPTPDHRLMGAADVQPTPEFPAGWRGDGTGRYPGANPPMEWSRRATGITAEIKYQANKPAGEPGKEAVLLENFTIKDWLVAGPFDATDPGKDIEKDFLGNETAVEPTEGAKAADTVWKLDHVSMETQTTHAHNGGICRHLNVDFLCMFARFSREASRDGMHFKIEGDFANKVAYAHTYIHSPTGGKVNLTNLNWGTAARAWLNGQPLAVVVETNGNTWNKKEIEVNLAKGWNRLLVKVASGEDPTKGGEGITSRWRTVAYLTPAGPVTYQTKNVGWMTRVTGRSMSQPVVVGDKIFFGSAISDLMCVSRTDGKVLWIHSNTPWDAIGPEDRATSKERIEPLVAQLDRLNEEVTAAINAMVSPQGMSSDQQAALDKKIKEKIEAEAKIHKEFQAIDRKRFPPMFGNEVSSSNATPCTDGALVYWACGGGMKGVGASIVCCFDLAGKRVWTHHESFGAAEHGLHTSPVLCQGKLIYGANRTLVAFDAATGKVVWKQPCPEFSGASPQVVRIAGEPAIFCKSAGRFLSLFRLSDGAKIASNDSNMFGEETPVVQDGVVYVPDRMKGWGDDNTAFSAFRLPEAMAEKGEIKQLFELKWIDNNVPLRGMSFWVASPLCVDELVYAMDMSGGLMAVDIKSQKSVYRRWLDWYARYDRFLYGAVASPTLGGKNIYLVDDAGYTIILKPGPTYQELGRNILENIFPAGQSGNPCKQEAFYSSPVFVGDVMYLKGEEYMYAIQARP